MQKANNSRSKMILRSFKIIFFYPSNHNYPSSNFTSHFKMIRNKENDFKNVLYGNYADANPYRKKRNNF